MSSKAKNPTTIQDIEQREGVSKPVIVRIHGAKTDRWINYPTNKAAPLETDEVEFFDMLGADWVIVEDAVTGESLGEHHVKDLLGISRSLVEV